MAATGFTPVYIYASGTTGNIPSASNLTNTTNGSEIALNYFDGKLFYKNASNSVVTVPLLQSSGSQNGWLSSTDWTTFNNKQPAGTYVTSVTGTAPVVSSGGTTPAISMAAATSSANGYLTSTDWSTFNGKQAALVSGTNIKTVSGTTLLGSGDLGTIGTAYGGTGLTGFTAANNAIYSTSSSALTAGTLPIAAGGTAQTSFTSGRIHYGSFSTSANLTTDGTDLTLGAGNLVIGTSGKGIDFSATAGTGTSELLADYEEGTFTPTVIGTTTAGTASYGTQKGRYTKVGRLVTIDVYVNWNSGTGTGDLALSGLPYTAANDATYASICLSAYGNLTLTAGNFMMGYVNVNSTTVYFEQKATGTGTNTSVAYDGTAYMIFSCTYTTT